MDESKFNETQYKNIYDESMQFHYWNLCRNDFLLNYIKKHSLNNILDIGSGRGLVTNFLHLNGIQIEGVELGDTTPLPSYSVKITHRTNALDLDPNLPIKTISLFDVIEHIEKPMEFLNQLISHLKFT